LLLRPAVRDIERTSDRSGFDSVTSAKSAEVMNRRLGVVGLKVFIAIGPFP
jgi:hypothetical protein